MPPIETIDLPERAVQFGTGAFVRGFIEYFVDAANRRGAFNGSIVAISSTGSGREEVLNEQDGLFTLITRGLDDGVPVQQYRVIGSLSRVVSAQREWQTVLDVARDPNIEIVFSNTTEIGIALADDDDANASPPRSFPAKLTRFLAERARAFDYDPARGVVVLPCELVENNGDRLRDLVRDLAGRWSESLDPRFIGWVDDAVVFCNTLVDRIVTGAPSPSETERLHDTLAYDDRLITVCESYRLFAIQGDDALSQRLTFAPADRGMIVAPSIRAYRERKVRVLNGAHSVLAPVALQCGLDTVHDAIADERVGRFLRGVMLDEIVPSLSVPDGDSFASDVWQRFANPFIRHALIGIMLHATAKMRVRVVPSIIELYGRTGRVANGIAFGFAAFLLFMRGDFAARRLERGLRTPEDSQADVVRGHWRSAGSDTSGVTAFVNGICADAALWGTDLTRVPEFAHLVADYLRASIHSGVRSALDTFLATDEPSMRALA
jgi:tagaturonate reductase